MSGLVREVRVDGGVGARVRGFREATLFAEELTRAGLRAEGGPAVAAIWQTLAAYGAAEARVHAVRARDPYALQEVGLREWGLLVGAVLGSLLAGGLFGLVAMVGVLTAGALLFLGRYAAYRQARRAEEADATRKRDGLREVLLGRVAEGVSTPWVVVAGGVRTVCSPDGDWLRACRRALADRRPGALALDGALKAEADRVDGAVVVGDVTRLDRGGWEQRLIDAGIEPPR